jgi:hypothetical protein
MEAAPKPDGAPEGTPAKTDLPKVESPPLSPNSEPAIVPDTPEPAIAPIAAAAAATWPRWALKARHKRYALLIASAAIAAALGAVVGALASAGLSASTRSDVAAAEENKAMAQSIARLGKEITTLKASLELANKSAHGPIARITERLEHAGAEVTGSILASQTAAPLLTPLPSPRPLPRLAAAETQPPARTAVVPGWTVRGTRGGYVYVENHRDIYQVALGAPLPGLGPVEQVKRQDGRWLVVTPKGTIMSTRDRRYFGDF